MMYCNGGEVPGECCNNCVVRFHCVDYKEWKKDRIKSFTNQYYSILDRHGVDPVDFIEQMFGIKLLFYQKWLLRKMFEERNDTFLRTYPQEIKIATNTYKGTRANFAYVDESEWVPPEGGSCMTGD